MLMWTVSPPLRTSLFSSLICCQELPLPSCSLAIFQRLSFSLTVYQYSPAFAGVEADAGRGSTSWVTGIGLIFPSCGVTATVSGIPVGPTVLGAAGADGVAAAVDA